MKPICFIPARGGSKGIPNKNIRMLGDKPLIAHTIESALDSEIFDHVIVSTDDPKIAEVSKKFGAEIPFIRSKELASDTATTDDVLIDGTKRLHDLGYKFDIMVMRDCTVPFIDKFDMQGALELQRQTHCDAVFAVRKAHPSPYFGMMELNLSGYLEPSKNTQKKITRRQDAPVVYSILGLVVLDVNKLLQNAKMSSEKTLPYEISLEHSHMIDFEFEFKVAECLYKLKQEKV